MVGLKRGLVQLCAHQEEWAAEARNTMARLQGILGERIEDIAHVGSTAIPFIQAKPIIDIAVAVKDFSVILEKEDALWAAGFYYRPEAGPAGQLLFACGSCYEGTGELQTHFIHIVLAGSVPWRNYLAFRDYLNREPEAAHAYEALKLSLAAATDGREAYTRGKQAFIARILHRALADSYLGKTVRIKIDRPLGSRHPVYAEWIYPVNYGYIPETFGGDGEEMDVYLLGVAEPAEEYTARVIGVIHRKTDVEDKLIAAPEGMVLTKAEIARAVAFQEQYFEGEIETVFEPDEIQFSAAGGGKS